MANGVTSGSWLYVGFLIAFPQHTSQAQLAQKIPVLHTDAGDFSGSSRTLGFL